MVRILEGLSAEKANNFLPDFVDQLRQLQEEGLIEELRPRLDKTVQRLLLLCEMRILMKN